MWLCTQPHKTASMTRSALFLQSGSHARRRLTEGLHLQVLLQGFELTYKRAPVQDKIWQKSNQQRNLIGKQCFICNMKLMACQEASWLRSRVHFRIKILIFVSNSVCIVVISFKILNNIVMNTFLDLYYLIWITKLIYFKWNMASYQVSYFVCT